jgi:hypothetical protein
VCEWFDSYGMAPEAELKMVPQKMRDDGSFLQDQPRLKPMIEKGFDKLIYNNFPLQKERKVSEANASERSLSASD